VAASPPSVVQVVLEVGRGGLETMCADLAIALAARGIRSSVIGLDAGGELEARLQDHGVTFRSLGGRRMRSPGYYRSVAANLRRAGATAVHTHGFAPLLYGAVSRPMAGFPRLVHTEHSIEYLLDRPALRLGLRGLAWSVHTFAVLGERMYRYYAGLGISTHRLRVIPNGVALLPPTTPARRADARQRLGVGQSFVIATVGRLAPEKNFPLLVDAFATAFSGDPDAALVFIGDGSEREALQQRATDRGIGDRVTFLGWRRDVAELLPGLDVFALSSFSEGLPMAMLEAMSAGVPVVSTAVGDIPNVVRDGVHGTLVANEDGAAMATALQALRRDPAKARQWGAEAQRAVTATYSRDAMVDAYCRAYGIAPGAG
jgi:glycosyltransferase involved in cell wall biosynthesis